MRDFLDEKLIDLKLRSRNLWQRLLTDEKGDTNFVAIIVLIVVIIAAAGVFRKQLTAAIDKVFDSNLNTYLNSGGNSVTGGVGQ